MYCTIYLVRHGETQWNIEHRIQGHKDSPLTQKGREQASFLGEKLKNVHFDAVFSSDLGRARQTAELITLSKKMAIQTTQALRERSFGPNEGMSFEKHHESLKKLLEKFERLTDREKHRFKFAKTQESDQELAQRLSTYLREIAVAYAGKTVLVVSHGGIIRAFLIDIGYGTFSELSYGSVKNTACIVIEADGTDFFLKEVSRVEKVSLT